jgi:predicted RNA-binding protein YlqC (UPF0109 family)
VKEIVETVVRHLVDSPDQVQVDEERDGRNVTLTVRVAEEDRGNVIGRGGGTAQALRTLLNGFGQKDRLRVDLEIVD